MKLRYIYIAIVVLITTSYSYCQSGAFEYDVFQPEKGVYEVSFNFFEAIDFQFIQIDLYDQDALIGTHEAIINKKQDNNYYLFFNNEEHLVYMDELKFVVKNTYGNPFVKQQFMEIRLLDSNFKLVDKYRKEIR